jgi:hypothetical protein
MTQLASLSQHTYCHLCTIIFIQVIFELENFHDAHERVATVAFPNGNLLSWTLLLVKIT